MTSPDLHNKAGTGVKKMATKVEEIPCRGHWSHLLGNTKSLKQNMLRRKGD